MVAAMTPAERKAHETVEKKGLKMLSLAMSQQDHNLISIDWEVGAGAGKKGERRSGSNGKDMKMFEKPITKQGNSLVCQER